MLGNVIIVAAAMMTQWAQSAPNRDYTEVQKRLAALPNAELREIGRVGAAKLPLFAFVVGKTGPNVLLSGAVHGDEPAGALALLEFFEKEASGYAGKFRFFVFPVVNPTGFVADRAEGSLGDNINRSFSKGSKTPEALFVMKQLAAWKERFAFAIDLHEIPPYWEGEGSKKEDNPHDAYLYETRAEKSGRIGRKMIDGLPKDITVCQWPVIYGDTAAKGLISYPEANRNPYYAAGTSLDAFVYDQYSAHTFTAETPTGWPVERRIRAHLSWLRTALDHYLEARSASR
jgi:murein peptide amidase A